MFVLPPERGSARFSYPLPLCNNRRTQNQKNKATKPAWCLKNTDSPIPNPPQSHRPLFPLIFNLLQPHTDKKRENKATDPSPDSKNADCSNPKPPHTQCTSAGTWRGLLGGE